MPTILKRANVKVKVNGQFQDLGLLQSDVATQLANEIAERKSNDNSLEANKIPYPQNPNSKYGNPGDILRTDGEGGTKWVPIGLPTDEQTQDAINNWLDEHPEATTTVENGSLTEAKFSDELKLKAIKDYVTPEMFGAKGDGETNNYNAIMQAFENAYENNLSIIFPNDGGYKTESPIVVENVPSEVIMIGRIIYNGSETALTFGTESKQTSNKKIQVKVYGNGIDSSVGVRFLNLLRCNLYIEQVRLFECGVLLEGNGGTENHWGNAYNNVFINEIGGCKIGLKLFSNSDNLSPHVTKGWTNENKFYGGKIWPYGKQTWIDNSIGIYITSNSYKSNHNVFYSPCLEELDTAIKIEYGFNNHFYDIRTENVKSNCLLVDDNSVANTVTSGYGITTNNIKSGNANKTPNIYFGYDKTLKNFFNYILFESGNLKDNFAGNQSEICIKKCSNLKQEIIYNPSYITLQNNSIQLNTDEVEIGTKVNTINNKLLRIESEIIENTQASNQIVLFIRMKNADGSYITSDQYAPSMVTEGNVSNYLLKRYYHPTHKLYCWRLQTAFSKGIYLTLPDECAEAWIGFAPAKDCIFKIKYLNIIAINHETEINLPNSEYPVLSTIPTNTTIENTFVRKSKPSSGNMGWIYDGAEWIQV